MNDKVSIILPVYNVQAYLEQCLDSIAAQHYRNWEAILVDDGSTDESGRICDRYAKMDSRFRVHHQKNAGAAAAKNAGLDCADGQYVVFVDSDDYVEPQWLETLVRTAVRENADVVEFDFDKVYRNCSAVVNQYPEPVCVFTAEAYLAQYLDRWASSLFWNKLFRAETIKSIRFHSGRRCIDDEFFTYKVLLRAERVVRIDAVLYHYRQRRSSAVFSKENKIQITRDALDVLIERYELVTSHYPRLKRIYLCHDIEMLFYFSRLVHNKETAEEFKRISRYYLWQALRCWTDRITMINICQIQMISKKKLLENRPDEEPSNDLFVYFE